MATLTVDASKVSLDQTAKPIFKVTDVLKVTDILGVAIFDQSGLPREYFVTKAEPDTVWVQIVFQALGLRSLLASSLQLEGFQQITIRLENATTIVVRRRQDYMALQFKGKLNFTSQQDWERLTALINGLDPVKLKEHPHFSTP